jgi:hypothetical protein
VELGKAASHDEVRAAPIDDVVVIVAARDRATHLERHLAQPIPDLPGLSRLLDPREGIEQRAKTQRAGVALTGSQTDS